MFFKTSPIFEAQEDIVVLSDREKLLLISESFQGTPYDASNKNGFDCSGFIRHCYKKLGYTIPRSSRSQFDGGKKLKRDEVKKGDIIVFKGSNLDSEKAGHVAIVHHFEGENIWFIHSSSSIGISFNNLNDPYYKKRLLGYVSFIDD